MGKSIIIRGAAEHNLKGLDVEIPRNRLTVVTGLSGSGKSSLAYDIIYREGQRRFVESLSAYARQYMGRLDKPKVEHIEGLSPTISIDQKTISRNPRSTVGTITEILDHLRLLYARLGDPHCPSCGDPIQSRTVDGIVDSAYLDWPQQDVLVCAPIVWDRKGEYRKELNDLREQGFVRVRIDGEVRRLEEDITLARYERHTLEVVYDRIPLEPQRRSRFAESVEKALELGNGLVDLVVGETSHLRSSRFACPRCDVNLPELEPRLFSFNSPHGACASCDGLGRGQQVDIDRLIGDPDKSLSDGALTTLHHKGTFTHSGIALDDVSAAGFDIGKPWNKWRKGLREQFLFGREATSKLPRFDGLVPAMEQTYAATESASLARFMMHGPCRECDGSRLRPESRAVLFRGRAISQLSNLNVEDALAFFASLTFDGKEQLIGEPIVREIEHRLQFMNKVGLGYLSLGRSGDTLSGGEAQRIRLASQLGSGLRGVLYVLDEPSIGLHPRDNQALLETLRTLRDLGNTVLVVEHDRETIEAADHVLDIGPGAGVHGGELVESGTVTRLKRHPRSLTGRFLSGKERIEIPVERRAASNKKLSVRGAAQHNLKGIDVDFPVGLFTAVTGVSGSGKSTLVEHILHRAVAAHLGLEVESPGKHRTVTGLDHFDKIIKIDQSPIGRTPRSNPGTYTKVFDEIRDLFAALTEAKVRGYNKGRFSFNVKGGRCENCGGAGVITINMQFLADVEVECEECSGKRYNSETLEVSYRGRNIADILAMPIEEACEFFVDHPKIFRTLQVLNEVGLGYVRLGQPSTTLSGGEAQRVKLAHELRKIATGSTLYLFDEPTTGLHFADIRSLIGCMQRLVDMGNTLIVIEHNLDVVKVADHVVDLGPNGGDGGGLLIGQGTPEQVARLDTPTGKALAEELSNKRAKVDRKGRKSGRGGDEPEDRFVITGARQHNLKNVRVEIPRGKLTVITGPSGSGKSTLAFDILFAEGQRRYVESLSTYARRFLGRMERAAVDRVEGIAPAIAIDQKSRSASPRSTVATTTEIYDYLRLLYARLGISHCPQCDAVLDRLTPSAAARRIEEQLQEQRTYILAPLHTSGKLTNALAVVEQLPEYADTLLKEGFARLLINGDEVRLEEVDVTGLSHDSEIHLVVDRLVPGQVGRGRLAESVEEAYRRGHDRMEARSRDGKIRIQATRLPSCPHGHFALTEELSPRLFSFNHHSGACPRCHGLGQHRVLDPDLLFGDTTLPLFQGAMDHRLGNWIARPKGRIRKVLEMAFEDHGHDLQRPVSKMSKRARKLLFEGAGEEVFPVRYRTLGPRGRRWQTGSTWEGLIALIARWHERADSPKWRSALEERMRSLPCAACGGGRLRSELLRVRVAGKGLHEVCALTIRQALDFFDPLPLDTRQHQIAEEVLREIVHRLRFLLDVGLDYLTLDRAAETLSGGEAQRIRLATQIGNHLVGVLYVLDEPTIGLHQRDNERLLKSLTALRDQGNSVVIVEHDEQTIRLADHVIDLGPGAGDQGGEIVAEGSAEQVSRNTNSLTGRYLSGKLSVPVPVERRKGDGAALWIRGARANNLRGFDVKIPLGTLTAVSGVSGSGKSSLVMDILARELSRQLHGARPRPGAHHKIEGVELLEGLGIIDQSPLGRSPSSNAATYTNLFNGVRELFARLPQAKVRGFAKGRFSYNVSGGRCEHCEGKGSLLVEMHFLSDVWVTCEECRGRRYSRETLEIRYKGKTIADVLDMRVAEALEFFVNHPRICTMLQVLSDVGLGYLALGQPAPTLSGGEAQRVKLAAELGKPSHGRRFYILDEPTTGLHFDDVSKLILVLQRLVDRGDTVVVIEHNLDVLKCADHIIDLGPEGGAGGGEVLVQGTPESIASAENSHTGRYLEPLLEKALR